ncbi:lytic transglycosylase domain-containing protein [Amycolatopsis sp. Hca4]|uniref:lytic transglycosylase domain-containing protein n=1 Tax=Amycolatopsis sp. Hca4 TaxID=2742131 RepID=UPI0020CB28D3|nr:lytic transglycosylase domain-containing protein [Amycolatopsis sp. Hca4]
MHTIDEARARLAATARARDTALVAGAAALTTCLWVSTVLALAVHPVRSVPLAETRPAGPPGAAGPVAVAVPGDPVEVPAAVPPLGVQPEPLLAPDPTAGASAASDLSTGGIPQVALRAYQHAAAVLAAQRAACHLDWALIAALGRVESNHGRFGGAVLTVTGRSVPPIRGPRLDGGEFALIRDTDGGRLDGDPVFDRAVGPLQFLPQTWRAIGADGDGDGTADPDDITDAALGAGSYLCSGGTDLADPAAARAAVYRYNHSGSYVALVLSLAERYRAGTAVTGEPGTAPASGTATSGAPVPPVTTTAPGTPLPPATVPPATVPPVPATTVPPATSSGPAATTESPTATTTASTAPPSGAGCVPVLGLLCL